MLYCIPDTNMAGFPMIYITDKSGGGIFNLPRGRIVIMIPRHWVWHGVWVKYFSSTLLFSSRDSVPFALQIIKFHRTKSFDLYFTAFGVHKIVTDKRQGSFI